MQPEKPFDLDSVSPAELLELVKKAGGQRAFARKHGIPRTTLQERLYKLRSDPLQHRPAPVPRHVGEQRGVRRFLLTSAQDGTLVHEQFLTNLEAYNTWLQLYGTCELMIGGFTYNKKLFTEHEKDSDKVVWDDRVAQYMVFDRIRIADKVDFCGEMNTLPTAENPLSGFHTYTRDRWGIFPHAKVQLVTVPTMKHLPSKQIMTTGACTMPNYVMKKAGIKASFHHVYGAVLVEIDEDGSFFCRHLIADDTGTFYDLDRKVEGGIVTTGHRVTAVTPGDIHLTHIDPTSSKAIFGMYPIENGDEDDDEFNALRRSLPRSWHVEQDSKCLLSYLRPEHVFLHDTSDFSARNHHNINDPHFLFHMHVNGVDSVQDEMEECSWFYATLAQLYPDAEFYEVDSNHDQALTKWLKFGDYRLDPANALFFLRCQLAIYEAIAVGRTDFSIFEHVMRNFFPHNNVARVHFLIEDRQPVLIDGVEHSNHGHRGPNGARGSVAALVRVATKMTIGHVHSPAIQDGLYASGTTSKMDLKYNVGPSSWAPSLVVQYENGKRAIITLQGEKYCVPCDLRFAA